MESLHTLLHPLTIPAKFHLRSFHLQPNPNYSLFHFPSSFQMSSRRRLQTHRRNFTFSLHSSNSSSKFYARAARNDSGHQSGVTKELIILNSGLTLVLGVANRVLYKLALVPMKEYPFFLAQVTTFGYLAIYLSILYARYRAGIVTKEMVAYPKSRFLVIGFLEALGVVSGMYAGAMLPGPAIPILNQTFLVWQLGLSVFILGRTYSLNQIAGCLLVAAGVVLAVTSGPDSNQMLAGIAFVWPVLMVASSAFQAAASVIKEFVFIDAASRLKGKVLDIFVVNSFGSGFQALFVLLLLPFLSNLKGIPFSELPSFLKSGAGCFFNIGNNISGAISHSLGLLCGLHKRTMCIFSNFSENNVHKRTMCKESYDLLQLTYFFLNSTSFGHNFRSSKLLRELFRIRCNQPDEAFAILLMSDFNEALNFFFCQLTGRKGNRFPQSIIIDGGL